MDVKSLFVGLFLSAATLQAGDVSGHWSGKIEFRYQGRVTGSEPAYVILVRQGGKLSGSAGPAEGDQHPIQEGRIEKDAVRFEMSHAGQTMIFDLRVKGDALEGPIRQRGSIETPQRMWMRLKRAAEE